MAGFNKADRLNNRQARCRAAGNLINTALLVLGIELSQRLWSLGAATLAMVLAGGVCRAALHCTGRTILACEWGGEKRGGRCHAESKGSALHLYMTGSKKRG